MRYLMLRGLAREQRHWGSFPALLTERSGAGAVTIDMPGFGTEVARPSPRTIGEITDDVRARFRAEHGTAGGPWAILGISLGGMVALDWLARHPTDFAHGVVVNTSSTLSPLLSRFQPTNYPQIVRALVSPSTVAQERAILSFVVNRADLDKEALAREWARFADERTPRTSSVLRQLWAASRAQLPAHIARPVLVVASRADRLVSVRCSEVIAERLRAPLALHDWGGHDLSVDDPAWLCDEVVRFSAAAAAAPPR